MSKEDMKKIGQLEVKRASFGPGHDCATLDVYDNGDMYCIECGSLFRPPEVKGENDIKNE